MSLSEKDVFYALLKNHHITLKRLCKDTNISYYRLTKRVVRNQLYLLPPVEMVPISRCLGGSFDDLYALLVKAKNGEFEDDYPREKIVLTKEEKYVDKRREIIMLLTPEEKDLIEAHRRAVQITAKGIIEAAASSPADDDKK